MFVNKVKNNFPAGVVGFWFPDGMMSIHISYKYGVFLIENAFKITFFYFCCRGEIDVADFQGISLIF